MVDCFIGQSNSKRRHRVFGIPLLHDGLLVDIAVRRIPDVSYNAVALGCITNIDRIHQWCPST